ncbi:hypothetical protein DR099_02845 [Mycoplasma hyopneumoniae]|nr:hypothetical protein [Mesomycoplasma hyopneumoniae]
MFVKKFVISNKKIKIFRKLNFFSCKINFFILFLFFYSFNIDNLKKKKKKNVNQIILWYNIFRFHIYYEFSKTKYYLFFEILVKFPPHNNSINWCAGMKNKKLVNFINFETYEFFILKLL